MKYERIQEIMRYVTPGLYLLAIVLVIHFDEFIGNLVILDIVSKFEAIIILLLPFVGFVIGYFIECSMTFIERGLYLLGILRPSYKVLNGKSKMYKVKDKYRKAVLNGVDVINNKMASEYQQSAKQVVGDNELVNRYYYQSIMARHILGAHLFASIYWLAFAGGWSLLHLLYASIIVASLSFFWYHQTCVYMKYLFAEYGKTMV